MRLHRFLAALLLGLPMATPIPVAAEDAPLAPEVQRRVAVVVLARRIRGYAAMAKASSDCQVKKGASAAPPGRPSPGDFARGVGHQPARADQSAGGRRQPAPAAPAR
ncbi:hypothetical protein [Synechococcus sp. N26]|uniref:hypothetical protein n=1 Tax=Synechococcus sp. N26 TaxID=2575513 RepID=UPI001FCB6EE6|nr:hypothetical protein [Synechococcus sp. N26]